MKEKVAPCPNCGVELSTSAKECFSCRIGLPTGCFDKKIGRTIHPFSGVYPAEPDLDGIGGLGRAVRILEDLR